MRTKKMTAEDESYTRSPIPPQVYREADKMAIGRSECEGVRTWGQREVQAEPKPYSYPFPPIERYAPEDITDAKLILDHLQYKYGFDTVFDYWDESRVKRAISTALACIRAEQHRRELGE